MQQEKAIALLKSGKNVFLTGSAGTGVKEFITQGNLLSMKSKKYLKNHLESVKVLIIDEISMLHKNQLNAVDVVLRFFKNNEEAFGGIQVVLCGDFFQLPPIGSQGETSKDKFSFMSEAWLKAKLHICYLTMQFRQEDNHLNLILNEIRTNQLSKKSFQQLKKAEKNELNSIKDLTKLYTHNVDVDRINTIHLMTLTSDSKSYKATTKGNKKLVETLKKSVLASEYLSLKIGARVMFVRNNPEKGYVNGSLGDVIGFDDEGNPTVKLIYNKKVVKAEKEEWSVIDDNGKTLASYNQIPLRLAWAITVHKCQGMTLDAAEIDLSKTFERGQGYVALSRLKKLENLKLIGINEMALAVDNLAQKADKRFQELSEEVDNTFNLDELEILSKTFIRDSGGLIDKKEITKHKNKIKEKENGKLSTYETTLMHLKQRATLKEIADTRGLTVGTVAGHLIKIRKDYPEEDLSFYRPKGAIIKKVKAIYDAQPKTSPVSLNVIFKDLGGKVSYDDIKLAVAFLEY